MSKSKDSQSRQTLLYLFFKLFIANVWECLTLGCLLIPSWFVASFIASAFALSSAKVLCVGPRPWASTGILALPRFSMLVARPSRETGKERVENKYWEQHFPPRWLHDFCSRFPKWLLRDIIECYSHRFGISCSRCPYDHRIDSQPTIWYLRGKFLRPPPLASRFLSVFCSPCTCPTALSLSSFSNMFSFIADSYFCVSLSSVGSYVV